MKDKLKVILLISGLIFSSGIFWNFSLAGNENYKEENHGGRERSRVHEKECSPFASDKTYRNTCGECHMAYPPMLLPSSSWKKIVDRLENHFGEQISIDSQKKEMITRYLMENGAERSSCKKAGKIIKSLQGKTPVRITDVPYIRDEHREIPLKVLERKKIGSLANCLACHRKADQGLFNESDIKIPS